MQADRLSASTCLSLSRLPPHLSGYRPVADADAGRVRRASEVVAAPLQHLDGRKFGAEEAERRDLHAPVSPPPPPLARYVGRQSLTRERGKGSLRKTSGCSFPAERRTVRLAEKNAPASWRASGSSAAVKFFDLVRIQICKRRRRRRRRRR
eukprot:747391-Hanusia_phi.AAC.2